MVRQHQAGGEGVFSVAQSVAALLHPIERFFS